MALPPLRRCSWQTRTGAARKRFRVKTPATVAPSAMRISSTSRRPVLRIAAQAVPISTPGTASSASRAGISRFTGIASTPWPSEGFRRPATGSPSGEPAVALLVLLARAAGTRIVAADLLAEAAERLLRLVPDRRRRLLQRDGDRFGI